MKSVENYCGQKKKICPDLETRRPFADTAALFEDDMFIALSDRQWL